MNFEKKEAFDKAKEVIEADGNSVVLDENHMETARGIIDAINSLPGVFDRVEAFMMGAGAENPKVEILALRDTLN